ncbi:hypothetical protein [Paenibacillus castaneae]|nr:hypothetical protein [Paenibacillus castaneae]
MYNPDDYPFVPPVDKPESKSIKEVMEAEEQLIKWGRMVLG